MVSNSNVSKDTHSNETPGDFGGASSSPKDELMTSKKESDDISGVEHEHTEALHVGASNNNDSKRCVGYVNGGNRHRDLADENDRASLAGENFGEDSAMAHADYSCVDNEGRSERDRGTLDNVTQTDSTANEPGPGNARASGASVQGEDSSDIIYISNETRVGAYRLSQGSVELMRSDAPGLARKREGRQILPGQRIAFADEDDETHNENDQQNPSINEDEDGAIPPTAYCVETGEHVVVTQTPIATAHRIDQGPNSDTLGDSAEEVNLNRQYKRIIPSDPSFVIKREGPTKDIVNSLLRFSGSDGGATEESTNSAVTIVAGMGGLGKSVLAATAVRDPAVLESFSSGVSWLSLGPNKLTSVGYRNSLLTLCSHISFEGDSSRDVVAALSGFPFSMEESEQLTKEEFKRLKAIVNPLLGGKKILIVLDDVWQKSDIELFAFGKECHMLVTTRKPDIADSSPSLEVSVISLCLPNEEESLQLLEKVLGESLTECETCSKADAREIIRRCHFLPLAIVSVGLLMKGCENFDSLPSSKILESLKPAGGGDVDHVNVHSSCYHVFDQSFRSLGFGNEDLGGALRLCFAAFCACFTNISGGRAAVPRTVVRNFFTELLAGHEGYLTKVQINEMRFQNISAQGIIQKLRSNGFLDLQVEQRGDVRNFCYTVHHDLQQQYGMKSAIIFEENKRKRLLEKLGWKKPNQCPEERARARANAVVVAFYERKATKNAVGPFFKQVDWSLIDLDDKDYVSEFILSHMILANEHKKAVATFVNPSSVKGRLEGAALNKMRILMSEEVKFVTRVVANSLFSPFFWIKLEFVYNRMLVATFISSSTNEQRTNLWIQSSENDMVYYLHCQWASYFELAKKKSPAIVLLRKISAIHFKKLNTSLTMAGLGDHPFALSWHAMFLLYSGEFERALEVRHRILALTQELFPQDHVIVGFGLVDLVQVYLTKCDYDEAILYANKFLNWIKLKYGTNDSLELASALAISGECLWHDKQTDESLKLFEQSRAMYERLAYHGEILAHVQDRLKELNRFSQEKSRS